MIDPTSVDDMAQGLRKMVFDNDYRRDLIEQGYRQIKKFSWRKAASEYVDLYETMMGL
jgi:glycosyltransferase involved in cell wall biosynthesis